MTNENRRYFCINKDLKITKSLFGAVIFLQPTNRLNSSWSQNIETSSFFQKQSFVLLFCKFQSKRTSVKMG